MQPHGALLVLAPSCGQGRRTALPEAAPLALTAEFFEDRSKQTQWLAFGKRLGLTGLPLLPLVGEQIAAFLLPVLAAQHAVDTGPQTWEPGGPWATVVKKSGEPQR